MKGLLILWVCYQKYAIADKKIAPLGYGTRSVAHFHNVSYEDKESVGQMIKLVCKCEEPYTFLEPEVTVLKISEDKTEEYIPSGGGK